MVIGLPQVKFLEGVCLGCEAGKHPEEKYDKGIDLVFEGNYSSWIGA